MERNKKENNNSISTNELYIDNTNTKSPPNYLIATQTKYIHNLFYKYDTDNYNIDTLPRLMNSESDINLPNNFSDLGNMLINKTLILKNILM